MKTGYRFKNLFYVWALAMFLNIHAPNSYAHGEDPDARHRRDYDKTLHFSVSGLATAGALKLVSAFHPQKKITTLNRIITSSVMLSVGYYKELYDARVTGKPFDREDMEADVYGVIFANIVQWQF